MVHIEILVYATTNHTQLFKAVDFGEGLIREILTSIPASRDAPRDETNHRYFEFTVIDFKFVNL